MTRNQRGTASNSNATAGTRVQLLQQITALIGHTATDKYASESNEIYVSARCICKCNLHSEFVCFCFSSESPPSAPLSPSFHHTQGQVLLLNTLLMVPFWCPLITQWLSLHWANKSHVTLCLCRADKLASEGLVWSHGEERGGRPIKGKYQDWVGQRNNMIKLKTERSFIGQEEVRMSQLSTVLIKLRQQSAGTRVLHYNTLQDFSI